MIIDDIGKICNIGDLGDFSFSCAGGKGIAFEGKYVIKVFENEKVLIDIGHKRELEILGTNLKIGTLSPKELGISGEISAINFGGKK